MQIATRQRAAPSNVPIADIASNAQMPTIMMQMMQMCMRVVGGGAGWGGGDCPLTFTQPSAGRKRSLEALAEDDGGAEVALARRAHAREKLGLQMGSGSMLHKPPAAIDASTESSVSVLPPRAAAAEAVEGSTAAAVQVASVEAFATEDAAATEDAGAAQQSTKGKALSLVEAIMAKKLGAKAEAAAAKAQAKANAQAEVKRKRITGKTPAEGKPHYVAPTLPVVATPEKPVAKRKAVVADSKTPARKNNAPPAATALCGLMEFKLPPGSTRRQGAKGIPCYSNESTRNQLQVRSGFTGPKGVNMAIKYGGETGLTFAKAEALALALVKEAKVRFAGVQ